MVRPPRRVQELQARATAVTAELRGDLGREPTDRQVRDRLGIDAAEYAEIVTAFGCFTPPSLDRPVGADGSATMGDLLVDGRSEHDAVEARCLVGPALGQLGSRDRHVLFLRFYEERSQREIGDLLGLTQAQVGRILERVLRTLRGAVEPESHTA
jgi:RNA polymerase sigma-B factor